MKLKVSYDVGELATVGAGYQMSSEAKTQSVTRRWNSSN